MSFRTVFQQQDWNRVQDEIYGTSSTQVENALNKSNRSLSDFCALLSPSAKPFLKEIAAASNYITQQRFGRTIQLFIPLYLSNDCHNDCVYCGFSKKNKIDRKILEEKEILSELKTIKSYGYQHILLVTGDSPGKAGIEYLEKVIRLVKPYFSLISIEVQPLRTEEYSRLIRMGLNTVYVYQETYNEKQYPNYHLSGTKADFHYRLDTPDRLGQAGVHKIGMGNLIGLEDWRTEAFFTALHLKYLQKKYWKTKYSISFPRLRPHQGQYTPSHPITDSELVQLICACRLLDRDLELSISVRESQTFRDNIIKLGITSMSAGSKTNPGGYSLLEPELEQFEVHDNRTPAEVIEMIKNSGYEPVWKDWDHFMQE